MVGVADEAGADGYYGLVRREIFPLLPERVGVLLDVGGGFGATASAIKREFGASRVGVIDQVKANDLARAGLDFAETGDLNDPQVLKATGVQHGPFDTILCLDILEHLVDPWRIVDAVHGILKPGGALIASIPNVRNIEVVLPLVFKGRWDYADAGILDRTHLRFFVKDTAIALLTSSGLVLEEVQASGLGPGTKKRLFDQMTFGLFRGFLEYQFLIRVRRPVG